MLFGLIQLLSVLVGCTFWVGTVDSLQGEAPCTEHARPCSQATECLVACLVILPKRAVIHRGPVDKVPGEYIFKTLTFTLFHPSVSHEQNMRSDGHWIREDVPWEIFFINA